MAKTQVATIWQSDRTVREVRPADGKKFTLQELQEAVGGCIEHVPHTRPFVYCNEEGYLIGLPVNALASLEFQQILVGDVIQVRNVSREPADCGCVCEYCKNGHHCNRKSSCKNKVLAAVACG